MLTWSHSQTASKEDGVLYPVGVLCSSRVSQGGTCRQAADAVKRLLASVTEVGVVWLLSSHIVDARLIRLHFLESPLAGF